MTPRMGKPGWGRLGAAIALVGVACVGIALAVRPRGGDGTETATATATATHTATGTHTATATDAATGTHTATGAAEAAGAACASGQMDVARGERVWRRLGDAPEGARLVAALPQRPRICFADVDPSVLVGRSELLLDARLDRDAAAARVGHLVSHLVESDALEPPATGDCAAFLVAALAAETRAHQLEARLLGALGAEGAAAEMAATAARRAAAVVDGYRTRCEARADAGG